MNDNVSHRTTITPYPETDKDMFSASLNTNDRNPQYWQKDDDVIDARAGLARGTATVSVLTGLDRTLSEVDHKRRLVTADEMPTCPRGWLEALFPADDLVCIAHERKFAVTGTIDETTAAVPMINFFCPASKTAHYGSRINDGELSTNCLENSGHLHFLPFFNPEVPEDDQQHFISKLAKRHPLALIMRCGKNYYAFFRASGTSRSYILNTEKRFRGYGNFASFAPWSLHPFPGGHSRSHGCHIPIYWNPSTICPTLPMRSSPPSRNPALSKT